LCEKTLINHYMNSWYHLETNGLIK
jgi:hypothetical protein